MAILLTKFCGQPNLKKTMINDKTSNEKKKNVTMKHEEFFALERVLDQTPPSNRTSSWFLINSWLGKQNIYETI